MGNNLYDVVFIVKNKALAWFKGLSPANQQRATRWGILACVVVIATAGLAMMVEGPSTKQSSHAPMKTVLIEGVGTSVTPQEAWAEKLDRKYTDVDAKLTDMNQTNTVLKKEIETITGLLKTLGTATHPIHMPQQPRPTLDQDGILKLPSLETPPKTQKTSSNVLQETNQPSPFPKQPDDFRMAGTVGLDPALKGSDNVNAQGHAHSVMGITMLTQGENDAKNHPTFWKDTSNYVPSGTHVKAILTGAMVASTATNASSDPRPMTIQLMDAGHMPRGWKSMLKDAVLVAACHGDLSSERAYCRLNTLSLVEPNGEVVDIDVEGWVFGEDGRYGVRGTVVDRASDIARESLMAGFLSGVSGYFQSQTSASLNPLAALGQGQGKAQDASGKDLLTAGAASGVGKALDRLSEFYIKRAEGMSPVLLVNAGRTVDIVFKKGFDLRQSYFRSKTSQEAKRQRQRRGR